MAKQTIPINRYQGISDSEKEGVRSSYLWGEGIDYRTDPTKLLLLPRATKESGNVVTDLVVDNATVGTYNYFYDRSGNIYKRDPIAQWSKERTIASSHGNGMAYFGEDDFLYYANDKVIGRYGSTKATPKWNDDFLGSEGGVPLNTASLELDGVDQYATAADSASLSITGDITLEGFFKPDTLPAAGSAVTLISKWNENGDQRSYYLDLKATATTFGDGADGALTISANTTQSLTDSACTGSKGSYTLYATNASFAAGDKIFIHQTQGTGAGRYERNEIASYSAGTITVKDALKNTYVSGAQVIVFPEYTNVTVDSGKTWTAKAWNGTVGGILLFLANGTVTVNGTISANGQGYRGGAKAGDPPGTGTSGESASGAPGTAATGAGIAGTYTAPGGGYGTAGTKGEGTAGTVGAAYGVSDLSSFTFGGAGAGNAANPSSAAGAGGDSGGAIFITATTITATGAITSNGADGSAGSDRGGGAGSGGAILLKAQTATLGSSLITASGGTGGVGTTGQDGGNGGSGRIHLDYYTSYSGTTSPTLDVTQDDSLVTSTTYALELGLSSTGANSELLSKNIDVGVNPNQWYHFAVKWDASASLAEFFVNANSIGTSTGALTAIDDSTALLVLGARFDSGGAAEQFFDGHIDDIRIFSDLRTASEIFNNKEVELGGSDPYLQAYYQVDSALTDSSTNSNTLTLVNTPTYDTDDVPFASPTTRNDLDQSNDDSGQSYSVPTAINEGATHRQSFVPAKDPQKSIEVNIGTVGTSADWTITVHDAQNRIIATKTVVNEDLHTGDFEFIFDTPWRPVIGQTYHFHLTVDDATGTPAVVTGTASDLEDADFHTYYQFLVTYEHHPIQQIINQLAIANERYLATWDGITYTPHKLTLPSGYKIRSLGIWREYLVMGVVLGDEITDRDLGYLFFWDGKTTTYNFYVPIIQGGVNSILSGDPLYFIAGYSGDLMRYEGGRPYKVRRMPYVASSDTLEVNRNALVMWKSLVHLGFSSSLESSTNLSDNFNDESIDSGLWIDVTTGTTTMTEQNDRLEMALPSSSGADELAELQSRERFDFTGQYMQVEIVEVPDSGTSADAAFTVYKDSQNRLEWIYEAGTLYAKRQQNGTSNTVTSFTFSSTTHKYWKIRESGGTWYMETSSDGSVWTVQATTAVEWDYTNVLVIANVSTYQSETDPGNFIIDNLITTLDFSVNSQTTASDIKRGVYSYGKLNERLNDTLSFDYPISTGNIKGQEIEIGMLSSYDTNLFISWRDGSSYGVDTVNPSNAPQATGRYESLITDVDKVWHDKMALTLAGYFKALSSGDSIQLEYKIDRNSAWTEGTAVTTAGEKTARLSFPSTGNRFYETQVAVEISTTNSTSPEFYGLGIYIDDLGMERRV